MNYTVLVISFIVLLIVIYVMFFQKPKEPIFIIDDIRKKFGHLSNRNKKRSSRRHSRTKSGRRSKLKKNKSSHFKK